ncbi:MAG: hypothetical protein HFG27_09565 [Provencibacterium sp.]|nr:hypothetical protein [Provencibacterium sp.]
MKKRFAALLAALLLFLLPVQANADVLVEPEDSFYRRHAEDCDGLFRWYQANGEEGYAAMLDQPGGHVIANIRNGTELFMSHVYRGSGEWGYTEQDASLEGIAAARKGGLSGWINLSGLRPVYDSVAFREDHAQQILPFSGDMGSLMQAERVQLWKYPGAPAQETFLEKIDDSFQLAGCYTDEDGRLWGWVGYYRGWRDIWVCLSDPENTALPERIPEQPPLYPAAEPPVPKGYPSFILAAVLVALVIGLTLFLLRRFWQKPE